MNLGLRYEMVTVPTEVQNKLSDLINVTDSAPHLGSPYFNNPTLHDFAPRVEFGLGSVWQRQNFGSSFVRGVRRAASGIFLLVGTGPRRTVLSYINEEQPWPGSLSDRQRYLYTYPSVSFRLIARGKFRPAKPAAQLFHDLESEHSAATHGNHVRDNRICGQSRCSQCRSRRGIK